MCVGIPMTVREVYEDGTCLCERDARTERVEIGLAGEVKPGDLLMVFRGTALRHMTEEEVREVNDVLSALADVMAGDATEETIRAGFPDLVDREPELPEHLKALVGKRAV